MGIFFKKLHFLDGSVTLSLTAIFFGLAF
jgi:hypothetical protein